MIAFGIIVGGAGAALTAGNFWQGTNTGLTFSGLNHSTRSIDGDGNPPTKEKGNLEKAKGKASALVNKLSEAKEYVTEIAVEVRDFVDTYFEMRDAYWVNSDKYFYGKANFKA